MTLNEVYKLIQGHILAGRGDLECSIYLDETSLPEDVVHTMDASSVDITTEDLQEYDE